MNRLNGPWKKSRRSFWPFEIAPFWGGVDPIERQWNFFANKCVEYIAYFIRVSKKIRLLKTNVVVVGGKVEAHKKLQQEIEKVEAVISGENLFERLRPILAWLKEKNNEELQFEEWLASGRGSPIIKDREELWFNLDAFPFTEPY